METGTARRSAAPGGFVGILTVRLKSGADILDPDLKSTKASNIIDPYVVTSIEDHTFRSKACSRTKVGPAAAGAAAAVRALLLPRPPRVVLNTNVLCCAGRLPRRNRPLLQSYKYIYSCCRHCQLIIYIPAPEGPDVGRADAYIHTHIHTYI